MSDNKDLHENPGCLGWLFSLLFDPLPPKPAEPKKEPEKLPVEEPKTEPVVEPVAEPAPEPIPEAKRPDYSQSYQSKYLLTKNEWHEYKKLRDFAEAKNLRVCPKVRLLDLVEPRRGEGYMSLLGKVQSKHVDFVITDKDLRIKAIVELDDNSHNRPDRVERDNFVDDVLTSVGYKVIRARSITEKTLEGI